MKTLNKIMAIRDVVRNFSPQVLVQLSSSEQRVLFELLSNLCHELWTILGGEEKGMCGNSNRTSGDSKGSEGESQVGILFKVFDVFFDPHRSPGSCSANIQFPLQRELL